MKKEQLKGTLQLLFATLIWGCAFVAQSVGMDHLGPMSFQAIRSALAVLALLPVAYLMSLTGNIHNVWWAFPIAEVASLIVSVFFFIRIYRLRVKPLY